MGIKHRSKLHQYFVCILLKIGVFKLLNNIMITRVMGERLDNMKSNENQVKYRIFDACFNGSTFSMFHGISAVLFDSKL